MRIDRDTVIKYMRAEFLKDNPHLNLDCEEYRHFIYGFDACTKLFHHVLDLKGQISGLDF